jgi:hypothetical protein
VTTAVAYNYRTNERGEALYDMCVVGKEFHLFDNIIATVTDIFVNPDKTATIKCFVEEEENKVRYYTVTQEGIHQVIEDV